MKLLLLLAATGRLAAGFPHGPDDDDDDGPMAKASPPAAAKPPPAAAPPMSGHDMGSMGGMMNMDHGAAPAAAAAPQQKAATRAPAGCRLIHTDEGFPSEADFKAALPGVFKRPAVAPKGDEGNVHPDYRVRAMNYADVQKAVDFARKRNIRLTVINSGHDFLGRNDAPSGLSLDVSLLEGIKVLEEFTPTAEGAAKPGAKANVIVPKPGKQAAVTIGVAMTTQKVNDALSPSKLVTVGAAHGSVAPAGGFGQTAGHSPISDLYGLGSDNFLEFKVVTPDGKLRVANKVANPDLFWALRGGGGSTFGVVVEATLKAHPDIPITYATFELNVTDLASDGVWDAYTELHRHLADFSTKRMSGYYYHYGNRLAGGFLHKADGSGKAKAEAIWEPLLAKMLSYGGLKHSKFTVTEYGNFKSYFDERFGKLGEMKEMPWDQAAKNTPGTVPKLRRRHGPGENEKAPVASAIANLDSRLLGATELAHPDLKAALKAAFPNGLEPRQTMLQGHLVAGGKVARPDDDTAVLPAWRTALTHMVSYKVPGKTSADSLRKLAPGSGAYANEAFALEPDWKRSFWGANYARLSQIKAKYDPDMLLWTTPGINADLYEARAGRVCKRVGAYTANTPPLSDNANNGRVLGQVN